MREGEREGGGEGDREVVREEGGEGGRELVREGGRKDVVKSGCRLCEGLGYLGLNFLGSDRCFSPGRQVMLRYVLRAWT